MPTDPCQPVHYKEAHTAEMAALAAEDPAAQEKTITAVTDDLLDEIDSILEEQAVLTNFRQMGGG